MRNLEKQLTDTSGTMERAQSGTGSDRNTLAATQNADSARIYCSSLDDWMEQHQRVINAINRLESGFHTAITVLESSELDAQAQARKG
jgi:hypothetical protein